MHIWLHLVAREAALLAILLLLGAGPASFLSERFDAGSRIGLAPALGFCLGTCVTTTLLQFAGTNDTYWILVALALASAGVAAVRTRRAYDQRPWRRRLPPHDIAALILVGLVVAGPVSYTLHARHTVGPAAYYYTDVDNYVALQDGARMESLHAARAAFREHIRTGTHYGNLTQFVWGYIADLGSNLDATPLDSNVNALLGLGATDTYAPFLTVLLLAGAVGAFAGVRYLSRSRTWTAALAGCLFGGPMLLELWFDSYQAAIIAVGLLLPFLVLVDEALQSRRRAALVLVALVLATMLTAYPLYVALLLGASGLVLASRAVAIRRAGDAVRPLVRPVCISLVAVAVMAIVFDPVGVSRDVRYYREVLNGTIALPRVGYKLPLSVLPGWIAQTREFWDMPPLGSADFQQWLLGGLLPLVFLGFAVVGLRRYRLAWALVGLGAVCAVVAEYSYASQQACTYCAERNLLPLTPIAAVLVALGLCALLATPSRRTRIVGMLGVALVVLAVGARTRTELTRFADGSYFMDSANRSVLTHLPSGGGAVAEEGFGASVFAQAEQPLIYHLINERAPGRASVILGSELGNAIQYLDFGPVVLPPGPEFNEGYPYVLTRFPGIATDRQTIARAGRVALEQRVAPLDLMPYAGLGVPLQRVSSSGVAWVQAQYPLQLLLSGYNHGRPAWARLTFSGTVPVSVPPQPGVRTRRDGKILTVCVRATGREPLRNVTLRIAASLRPGIPPNEQFPPPMPLEGLALTAMRAVTGTCTP